VAGAYGESSLDSSTTCLRTDCLPTLRASTRPRPRAPHHSHMGTVQFAIRNVGPPRTSNHPAEE
jgi:hypothetical protein